MPGSALCIANLKILTIQIDDGSRNALDKIADDIYTLSKYTYCPVDTGALRGSANNEVIVNSPNEYTRRISYGGKSFALHQVHQGLHSAPVFSRSGPSQKEAYDFWQSSVQRDPIEYAADVHENPKPMHAHPPTATWKYLSIPFEQISPRLGVEVKIEVGKVLS
jgi:hypothetical protein